tara:strand:- start:3765 stop:5738 length:1974 start_codon:yes stop_codon:yes gene_type:complete
MIVSPRARLRDKRKVSLVIDSSRKGVSTLVSETRLDKDYAKELTNMYLVEDGVATKRPGTAVWSTVTFDDPADGFSEFTKADGTRELIVVASGKVWRVTTTTKTEITGATFTIGTRCQFIQYRELLYIVNGVDSMAVYNGTDIDVYTGISAPAWDGTPLTRGAGLSTGNFTYYYQITAVNDVGETAPAVDGGGDFIEKSIAVDIVREDWDEADEYIQLDWADVAGATRYNIYVTDVSGNEYYLDTCTTSTYQDTGGPANPFQVPPDADTTTAPKVSHLWVSNSRLWGAGDPTKPQRVYFTGTGPSEGTNWAVGAGGGRADLQSGSEFTTVGGIDFQNKSHVFMDSANGDGSIWEIPIETETVLTETFDVPTPKKIISAIGCSSARSIVYVENDILYFNKKGVYVLGNEPNIANVLRTNELSASIRPDIIALSSIDKVVAHYQEGKVYFCVSSTTGEPDKTIVFDRERSAWINNWSIGFSQIIDFTDSSNVTHLLGIHGDHIDEISSSFQADDGVAFTWRYKSPRLPIVKDWKKFGKVIRAYIRLRNAQGNIDITISGTGKTAQLSSIASSTITPGNSNTGIGWDLLGSVQVGDTDGVPTFFSVESLIKYLRLSSTSNVLRDIQWEVSGDSVGDSCVILGLMIDAVSTEYPLALSDQI